MNKITITKEVNGEKALANVEERTNIMVRLDRINALYEELQDEWKDLHNIMYWDKLSCSYVDSDECSNLLDFDEIVFRDKDFDRLIEAAEESEEDMYIGLTEAYFAEDDGSIFVPDYWAVTNDPDELAECKGLLTYDGVKRYGKWAKAYYWMNEYQRENSYGYDEFFKMSKWDIYTDLVENYTYKIKEEQE